MDKKILNVNINHLKKEDKPRGGGSDKVDKVFFCKIKALFYHVFFLALLLHI